MIRLNYLFLHIIIYSFIGWIFEVIYAYKNQKKFINRGFFKGPICPIYGFCTTLIILLLRPISCNIFLLFLTSTIIISFIEYITSFALEKLFNKRYWDYTDDPFNIKGRICLHFSLFWGLLAIVAIKIIHPAIVRFISLVPAIYIHHTINILWTIVILDIAYTLFNLLKAQNILDKIPPFKNLTIK